MRKEAEKHYLSKTPLGEQTAGKTASRSNHIKLIWFLLILAATIGSAVIGYAVRSGPLQI
jgi:hypothetical protein